MIASIVVDYHVALFGDGTKGIDGISQKAIFAAETCTCVGRS